MLIEKKNPAILQKGSSAFKAWETLAALSERRVYITSEKDNIIPQCNYYSIDKDEQR